MNKLILAIPTYNRPDRIRKLLECLRQQDDTEFTTVVLNDGCNKESEKILHDIQLPFHFYPLSTPTPSGLPAARNKLLDFILENKLVNQTTYVAFLDDDLVVDNDFIRKVKEYSEVYDAFSFHIHQTGPVTTYSLIRSPFLQKMFSPLIGKLILPLGIIFGGFYIRMNNNRSVDHLMGCCMIYNLSNNLKARFDLSLNEGNFVGEDTCFTYGLKRSGNQLYFISNYTVIHESAPAGGSRIPDQSKSFFWYWKHKLYIINKFSPRIIFLSAVFFCIVESLLLSIVFKKNLVNILYKSLRNINTFIPR